MYRAPEIRRPDVVEAIRKIIGNRPVSYGYRRIYGKLKESGIQCNCKTVYRYLQLHLWLSTHRQQRVVQKHREGTVAVTEPNTRWASDITVIKAWNGDRGRFAIIIDCADRQILGYRWSRTITGDDMQTLVKVSLRRRFSRETVPNNKKIEFLSDNGPEYRKISFRRFLRHVGFEVCNTPLRSPESNGIAEAFFKSFKRDYVYQHLCETFDEVGAKIPAWVEDYNTQAPHSALGLLSPAKFYEKWVLKNRLKVAQI